MTETTAKTDSVDQIGLLGGEYLTVSRVAYVLNKSSDTLRNWRERGEGPPWVAGLGYPRRLFLDWIAEKELVSPIKRRPVPAEEEVFLLAKEVAERLSVNDTTLRYWRNNKKGPVFVKFGGAVRYPLSKLLIYIEQSTTETGSISS